MKPIFTFFFAVALLFAGTQGYSQSFSVGKFHEVIVSPYIQVTFVQGDAERVAVEEITVDSSLLHVEVHNGTLRIWLEGAKEVPKTQEGHKPLYKDHSVIATVTYRRLDALSLRGSERFIVQSNLSAPKFSLKLYGESKVVFSEVHIDEMSTTMYGEGTLDMEAGAVTKQHYVCYGEGKIDATAIRGEEARFTAYGESELAVNVSDRIKISAFGEAKLRYKGTPEIVKGIHIGEVSIKKID